MLREARAAVLRAARAACRIGGYNKPIFFI
jgi:hypothetical protein